MADEELWDLMVANELPYVHYYTYGKHELKVVEPAQGRWVIRFIARCAEHMKNQ